MIMKIKRGFFSEVDIHLNENIPMSLSWEKWGEMKW